MPKNLVTTQLDAIDQKESIKLRAYDMHIRIIEVDKMSEEEFRRCFKELPNY